MKKQHIFTMLAAFLVLVVLSIYEVQQESKIEMPIKSQQEGLVEEQETPKSKKSAEIDFSKLKHTERFTRGSLPHIFYGEINSQGNAVGYHSEYLLDTPGQVVEGTRTNPNKWGVYSGQVTVDGVKKAANRGYSTFFPEEWAPQQVIDAINEAYKNRQHDSGNIYLGETEDGMVIQMYLTDQDKIISAFPVY